MDYYLAFSPVGTIKSNCVEQNHRQGKNSVYCLLLPTKFLFDLANFHCTTQTHCLTNKYFILWKIKKLINFFGKLLEVFLLMHSWKGRNKKKKEERNLKDSRNKQ